MPQSQYATIAQLSSIAITEAQATRFGDTAMTACLQSASGLADSYLRSQFTLPLQTTPIGWDYSLVIAVCNIAAYTLYCQVGFNPNSPADKLVEERYNRSIKWLEEIRDEKLFPNWIDAGSTGSPEAGPFSISDPPVGFDDNTRHPLFLFPGWFF